MIQPLRTLAAGLKRWVPVSCATLIVANFSTVFGETKPAGLEANSFSVRILAREDDPGAKLPVTRQELADSLNSPLESALVIEELPPAAAEKDAK